MPVGKSLSPSILQAALSGLEMQRERLDQQIAEVRSRLGAAPAPAAAAEAAPKGRRELSPAARKRIADAQKKRWAEFRKKKASGPKKKQTTKAVKTAKPETAEAAAE